MRIGPRWRREISRANNPTSIGLYTRLAQEKPPWICCWPKNQSRAEVCGRGLDLGARGDPSPCDDLCCERPGGGWWGPRHQRHRRCGASVKKHRRTSAPKMVGSREFEPRRRDAIFCSPSAAGELRTASEPRQSRPVSVCVPDTRKQESLASVGIHRYGETAPGFLGGRPAGRNMPANHKPIFYTRIANVDGRGDMK